MHVSDSVTLRRWLCPVEAEARLDRSFSVLIFPCSYAIFKGWSQEGEVLDYFLKDNVSFIITVLSYKKNPMETFTECAQKLQFT